MSAMARRVLRGSTNPPPIHPGCEHSPISPVFAVSCTCGPTDCWGSSRSRSRIRMSVFANEVIVITGAGSGLGREMAKQLAAAGASVGAIDRNGDALRSLEKELDGKPVAVAVADVTDADVLTAAVRELEAKLGPAERLIANAGIGCATPVHDFAIRDFAAIVNVNLLGVANTVAAMLPGMIERRRGHLVAISSLASFRGLPLMSAYCASKAGVSSFFDSLAI